MTEQLLYGKFKDADSLLAAYRALESEFTKRSQRLKALERDLAAREQVGGQAVDADKAADEPTVPSASPETEAGKEPTGEQSVSPAEQQVAQLSAPPEDEETLRERFFELLLADEAACARVIEQYLTDLSLRPSPPVLSGTGKTTLSPVNKPKTLEECRRLAELYFNGRG